MRVLEEFAELVGHSGPVRVVGGNTRAEVGGAPSELARVVSAPAGIITHEPADMVVRVLAGTLLESLQTTLAGSGQRVILDGPAGSTVGGVLAVGRSGVRRRGDSHVRNAVLGARVVDHSGTLVTVGGATVKNVTGYDLCRLLVGSLGTLAVLAEVILRTLPAPERSQWVRGDVHPGATSKLYRPVSVLWDGTTTWVLIEGVAEAVEDQLSIAAEVGIGDRVGAPPALPAHRWSVRPGAITSTVCGWDTPFVAEIGVGTIHATDPSPERVPEPGVVALHRRLRDRFDPGRRLNPGREPLMGVVT